MIENRIYIGDSAVISASITDDATGAPLTLTSVAWEFLRPDGSSLIVSTLPANPPTNTSYVLSKDDLDFTAWSTVTWDGRSWLFAPGTSSFLNTEKDEATLVIAGVAVDQSGVYRGRARLTLDDGTTRSVLINFESFNPLESSMPVELPITQYFTNQFLTSVLTISDSQAYVTGIDVGATITITGPGFSNVTVPSPPATENYVLAAQVAGSTFTAATYEYLIAYRKTVGTDGNYVEGWAGINQTVALDSSHTASLTFGISIDPSLSRTIYRRVANTNNWQIVAVLDNTPQTWVDNGAALFNYGPAGWYGSANLNVVFYVEQPGSYNVNAGVQFTVAGPNGRIFPAQRTLTSTTTVYDPRILNSPANTVPTRVVDHAWMKLEDLWDSEFGGPWLSDTTFKSFDKDKLALLLPDALYLINNEFQPITNFTEADWPEDHIPLASQALMVEGIYHLIRSYVEQPLPAGGTLNWYDRRDYLSRWQSVLQKEEDKLMHLADKFKLQFTGFGSTSMIVGGYATPITRLSRFWRTRYPRYIGPWGF